MSVRKRTWVSPKTGKEKKVWMIDVSTSKMNVSQKFKPAVRRRSPVQTRRGAEVYEGQVRAALLDGSFEQEEKEVPTFKEWFHGRFWNEWVVGMRNKPSEKESKLSIYKHHLNATFGHLSLQEIVDGSFVQKYRATLVEQIDEGVLKEKTVNNILAVLSKALNYAEEERIIDRVPRIGFLKMERPENEWWEFVEYARILKAAEKLSPYYYLAACLSGEAGTRDGENKSFLWERDIDLIAGTITVNEQTRRNVSGTPKGRTRRTIPMTETLKDALTSLSVVRRGPVLRNEDGSSLTDGQTKYMIYRICRTAGLPEKGWHKLRHTFATHSALMGVNPWSLQRWLGHKRIDETMRYVHAAESHGRSIPEIVLTAGRTEMDPDRRIVKMLSARKLIDMKNDIQTAQQPHMAVLKDTKCS